MSCDVVEVTKNFENELCSPGEAMEGLENEL